MSRSFGTSTWRSITGEIVALIGDNGAGKSTLIKVITGVHTPTAGEIYFKGKRIGARDARASRSLGIECVYQERALAEQQELWRNVFAGHERTTFLGFLDLAGQRRETEKLMRTRMGLTSSAITVDSEVGGSVRWRAPGRRDRARALLRCRSDHPRRADHGPVDHRNRARAQFTRSIRDQGKSAIFIDHNIFHVYDVADRFVILDRGRIAERFLKSEVTRDKLVDTMVALHHAGKVS